jgi:hypothetical protein
MSTQASTWDRGSKLAGRKSRFVHKSTAIAMIVEASMRNEQVVCPMTSPKDISEWREDDHLGRKNVAMLTVRQSAAPQAPESR